MVLVAYQNQVSQVVLILKLFENGKGSSTKFCPPTNQTISAMWMELDFFGSCFLKFAGFTRQPHRGAKKPKSCCWWVQIGVDELPLFIITKSQNPHVLPC